MKIAVSGATGFIGSHLIRHLLENNYQVVALSRSAGQSHHPLLQIKQCDLYIKQEIDEALQGCDMAIYLVHSMSKPNSKLVQGDFQDFDFLLADNFARSAKKNNLKQIIYVSGLLPKSKSHLSQHLSSRFEVEEVLHDQSVPVTALRCGLVIGSNGSSFKIVERLVKRLPVMVLPRWMRNETQAVYIDDLIKIIINSLNNPTESNRSYDIAYPEILTYQSILEKTIQSLNLKRKLFQIDFVPIALSKFWVSFITKVPKQLVYPLVDSLVHELIADPKRLPPSSLITDYTPIEKAISQSLNQQDHWSLPVSWFKKRKKVYRQVQSVQRLPFPKNWTIDQIADEYKRWMPQFFRSLIKADTHGNEITFYALIKSIPLLKLKLREDYSYNGRKLFDITGGWLAKDKRNGVLEFREGLRSQFAITAIFRYRPRLIWFIYILTQAQAHAWVMAKFGQHLKDYRPNR